MNVYSIVLHCESPMFLSSTRKEKKLEIYSNMSYLLDFIFLMTMEFLSMCMLFQKPTFLFIHGNNDETCNWYILIRDIIYTGGGVPHNVIYISHFVTAITLQRLTTIIKIDCNKRVKCKGMQTPSDNQKLVTKLVIRIIMKRTCSKIRLEIGQ